ncbi:hypothetical protein COPG_00033 [Colwellia phage 9A]|uniref:Uncharacterized protein n=1 Tax=Colwellia phage 9A TaxID=765765 RepID=I3UMB4_9CAUD|nr:hypothetical protein COPG_00033 [Colwellia phage 9A]AFK66629.1 hypothetical protein COPG_00033 [Colwellia phage 9A]
MSKIDPIRQGEISLLILQTTQTDPQKWMSLFKNREEVEYALNDGNNCLSRLPSNQREVAKERLELALDQIDNSPVSISSSLAVGRSEPSHRPKDAPYTTRQPQMAQATMAILETDKGSFYHMATWKAKLSEALKHMEGFDQIFAMSCLLAKIDPSIDYISETKKKAINGKLSECSALYIEQLTATL